MNSSSQIEHNEVVDGTANTSNISLDSLSKLVGFPADYLKKELLVEGNDISLSELRTRMLSFLENNFSH
jgi:hypothetical protein